MTNHRKHPSTTLTLLFTAVSTVLLFMACDSTMITDPAVIEELHAAAVERTETGEMKMSLRDTTDGKDPLIYINGVNFGNKGLSELNPRDIESITVLKDASAEIYGPQAKNGVILITLKPNVENEEEIKLEFEFETDDTES